MRRGETKESWGNRGESTIGGGPSIGKEVIVRSEGIRYLPIVLYIRRKRTSRRRRSLPNRMMVAALSARKKSGDWRFFKSQKDAAEAFPRLIQGIHLRLINNPREVSRHIRERFEARNVGPKTTRQLNHPPPSTEAGSASYLRGNQPVVLADATTGTTSRRWRGAPKFDFHAARHRRST